MNQFPLTITPGALCQIKNLLTQRNKPSQGIRIGVKTRGCSGYAYTLEFVDVENPQDEKIQFEDIKVFVDPKATMFILGTEMDYVEKNFESGFTFKNPNEKGRCGCGESFHI